jgi:hypothetical protein
MNISKLLATRQALLRQTQLANLAYAYATLQHLARRIATANLHGLVRLEPAHPDEESYWPSLTALEGNQSVIEEHFTDQDIMELAESLSFSMGDFDFFEFRLEELNEQHVLPIRQLLEQSGIVVDAVAEQQNHLAPGNAD